MKKRKKINKKKINTETSKLDQEKEEEKEKQKQPLDSRVVLNLIEVIKFIIQRKTFVILYESYINHAINQQYSIAFSYFVAICKQYPFKKLEEFYNYKTYNYAFRQLLRPFNRYNFKYFISRFQYKKKVEYMQILLTKMIKFKTLERIYLYGQCIQEDDEEEKAFRMIIMKIMGTLIRPHLFNAFNLLKENLRENNNDNYIDEGEDLNSNLSEDKVEEKEEKEEKEENEVNFNISDDDDILSNKSYNNNNDNKLKNILNKEEEKNQIDSDNNNNNYDIKNIININSDNKNEKNNQNIEKEKNSINLIEYLDNVEEKKDIKNQRRKNDSSLKMNSYLYESLDSSQKSSLSIEPNSLDNDKLHKLKLLLQEKNKNLENEFNDNDNIEEVYMGNSSKKSDKSLQEFIKMGKKGNKTLSDMMDENSYQKSPEDRNEFNNLKKTLRSQISEGKNDILKDEATKVVNDTKDTKEVTDDSNTFNLNTNNKSDNDKNKLGIDTNSNSEIKKSNIQNIKINNIQKKIDYEEEEKNAIKIHIEENKEISEIDPENPKKIRKKNQKKKKSAKTKRKRNLI